MLGMTIWWRSRAAPGNAVALARASLVHGRYIRLDEAELQATRRSDVVYVFGSGASFNELSDAECEAFERAQTIGFNWFVRQQRVRVDYHLLRELSRNDFRRSIWRHEIGEYGRLVRESRFYADTIFLVQRGFSAVNGNRVLGLRELRAGTRIFRWRSATGRQRLGSTFADGLTNAGTTLDECVNFAALLGFRRIVLVGVDLYDRRYFWLAKDEARATDVARGATPDARHATATRGMIDRYARWRDELAEQGIALEVYNPRSLLAEVLPVSRSAA